ncbi:MAG: hypothetical protein ACO1SV_19210 [Fimbriimonas sp.]
MRFLFLPALFLVVGCGSGGSEAPVSKTPDPPKSPEQTAAEREASERARGQAESYRQGK